MTKDPLSIMHVGLHALHRRGAAERKEFEMNLIYFFGNLIDISITPLSNHGAEEEEDEFNINGNVGESWQGHAYLAYRREEAKPSGGSVPPAAGKQSGRARKFKYR